MVRTAKALGLTSRGLKQIVQTKRSGGGGRVAARAWAGQAEDGWLADTQAPE